MSAPTPDMTEAPDDDVRPIVGMARRDWSLAAIAATAALGAIVLFLMLDGQRRAGQVPQVQTQADGDGVAMQVPPPLRIPPDLLFPPAPEPRPAPLPSATPVPPSPPLPVPRQYEPPQTSYVPQPPVYQPPQPDSNRSTNPTDPALVIDTTIPDVPPPAPNSDGNAGAAGPVQVQRTRAASLRNRGTTVAQGTLIPAVLESALNSSQPGLARALVSRDIRGFDGSRVLIPRGSRLIGEYKSDLAPGQKRALVTWTRLIRPDGATIAIGSPASDPLGRGGIKGKVNSHFLERFGSAILQSVLDIGVNLATSRIGNAPVIVGLPNDVGSGVGQAMNSGTVAPPTISVRQGTAISIFVARDLDFTAVEGKP